MNRQRVWKIGDVDLYFYCGQCDQWILEGNPGECPHQEQWGQNKVVYDAKRDGPVDFGLSTLLRRCGYASIAKDFEKYDHPGANNEIQ